MQAPDPALGKRPPRLPVSRSLLGALEQAQPPPHPLQLPPQSLQLPTENTSGLQATVVAAAATVDEAVDDVQEATTPHYLPAAVEREVCALWSVCVCDLLNLRVIVDCVCLYVQ